MFSIIYGRKNAGFSIFSHDHTFCFRGNPVRGAAKRIAQRRRRGAAEPRVEEHATAGSGTLGSGAECGFSPARAAQLLCRPCRHARQAKRGIGPSAESAAQQSPGRKPWEWHEIKPALKARHRFSSILESLCRPCRAGSKTVRTRGFTPGFAVARFQRWDLFCPRLKRILNRAEAKSVRH
jgi:hypothetical protein